MTNKPPLTEFDMVTIPPSFQIMKAMLPFLDINLQKILSLIIRFMELKQTLDFFNYANNITSMSTKNTNADSENTNFLFSLLNNEAFMNSIAPYLPENYKSMISSFKMFSSISDLFNQNSMDISDILGKYMGATSTNENNQNNPNPEDTLTQNNENDGDNNSNNNASNQTRQLSEADKGFSIFSNAMNQDQQKLFDEYLKELDNLDLSKNE